MVSSSQVGVFNFPALTKTSYASEFTFPERQPTSRFHDYVSFVLNTKDKLVPRCFPHFALHVSPHRILDYERSALGFGPTGAEYVDAEQRKQKEADAEHTEADEKESCSEENSRNNLDTERSESRLEEREEAGSRNQEDEKAVTRSLRRVNFKSSEIMAPKQKFDIPKHILDEVTTNLYKTTTQKAAEECPLLIPARPVVLPSIIGNNEDRELYHSVYRRTGTWKTNVVPDTWERSQERSLYEDPKAKQYRPCRLRFSKPKTRLLCKRQQQPNEVAVTKVHGPGLLPPTVQHVRPSPGYAGFVPKLPVIPSPARDPRLMLSSSAATYRNVSRDDLRVQEYAHKGPLSKLVTTTTPCNPFNKTTQMSQLTSGLFVI